MAIADLCHIVPAWPEVMSEQQWLDARQSGIGGSEIGAIAGLSKYESKYSIWARKVHNANSFEGNEATDLGHLLEASVALQYAREHNAAVVEWPVILRSKTIPFLSANVDRFILEPCRMFPAREVTTWKHAEPPPSEIICLLECKTGALASPGSPIEWFLGPDSKSIPDGYACQGFWYLAATGLDRIEYACLLGGYGMQYRTQLRDQATIDGLLTIGERFWNDHVLTEVAPELDGSSATEESMKAMYPTSVPGSVVEGGEALRQLSIEFEEAKAATKAAIAAEKLLRAQIVAIIGDNETATVDGVPIYTFKSSKETEYLSDTILKAEDPETYAKYTRTRPGYRVLRKK